MGPEIDFYRRTYKTSPLHASTLNGICMRHGSFSQAVKLALNWVNSHMFCNHLRPEAVELIMAHCYLSPSPFPVPKSAFSGFVRFLNLLATWEWGSHMLFVDLKSMEDSLEVASEMSVGHMTAEASTAFEEQRAQQAVSRKNKVPAMFLLAYYDRLTVLDKALNDDVNDKEHVTWSPTWTSQRPSKIVLSRIVSYAKSSTKTLEGWLSGTTSIAAVSSQPYKHSMWRAVFETPLNVFDVLIETNQEAVYPRQTTQKDKAGMKYKNLFIAAAREKERNHSSQFKAGNELLIGLKPVEWYVSQLERKFGHLAFFFYNSLRPDQHIGVIWKPGAFIPSTSFKVSEAGHCFQLSLPIDDKKVKGLKVVNIGEVLASFRILGGALVENIIVDASLNE